MVSMKRRWALFASVTVLVGSILYSWERPVDYYPPPNVLGSTWYGPVLLLLIPATLAWVSWGAKRRWVVAMSLVFTLLLAAVCAFFIVNGIQGTQPMPIGPLSSVAGT